MMNSVEMPTDPSPMSSLFCNLSRRLLSSLTLTIWTCACAWAQPLTTEIDEQIHVAIVKYVRPAPNEEIVDASIESLKKHFGEDRVKISHLSISDLTLAIRQGDVDVFLSSAGFYRRMSNEGVIDLVTAVSKNYPDPNHGDGAAFVTAANRADIETPKDFKGRRLITSTPRAFTGLLVPYGELMHLGFKIDGLFSEINYLGDDNGMEEAPYKLIRGEADVAFLRLCFLEEWFLRHPEHRGKLKVINRKDLPGEACVRSADLYPTWTVAATKFTNPEVSRLVTHALIDMPRVGHRGLHWGVATDYSGVDRLFRETRTGPYAYLNTWTLNRFVEEYWPWLMLAGVLILGLSLHSVRVTELVKRRTEALTKSLAEQRQLQEEAKAASQRLERLECAGVVAQLSVIFAHEMRQPLGAISLYSFGLRRLLGQGSKDVDKMLGVLDKLDEQTTRANDIVTRVRSYAKSETVKRESVLLAQQIEHAAAELKTTGRYESRLEVMVLDNPVVMADPLEMELVALNLMKNALEATDANHPGGSVMVTLSAENDRAILSVSDEGDGTKATVDRLMTGLESMKAEGLGLGISIVRGILEAYGGRLTYAVRRQGGLIARVTLPLNHDEKELNVEQKENV